MHRILYLIGQLGVGGAERQLIYLATHLDRSRFEPIVCSLSTDLVLAGDLHAAGVEVIVLPKRMSPDVTRLWRVLRLARRYRPALIHSYLFVANTWARTTGVLCRLPVIVSERTARENGSRFQDLISRLLAPATTLLVANSHAGAALAVRSRKITPDRLAVVYNGISVEPFRESRTGARVRDELHLGPQEPVVGIVGRLNEAKDHATFFDAMASVVREMPEVRILCVGDGALRDSLRRQVAQLGIENRTVFTGMRSDIPAIMSALDLLVLSSRREAFPNVVMEAMAAARPVVATRVGDVERLVGDGQTGVLVPPGNPQALASAILRVLADLAAAAAMGRQGRARVEAEFSMEQMVSQTQSLYERALSREGKCA